MSTVPVERVAVQCDAQHYECHDVGPVRDTEADALRAAFAMGWNVNVYPEAALRIDWCPSCKAKYPCPDAPMGRHSECADEDGHVDACLAAGRDDG